MWILHLDNVWEFYHDWQSWRSRLKKLQCTLGLCWPGMPLEDDILEFLIFCSFQVYKSVEREKNDFFWWPFEGTYRHALKNTAGWAGWQVTQKATERSHFFLSLHFCILERSKISKIQECHLQVAFQVNINPVCKKWSYC